MNELAVNLIWCAEQVTAATALLGLLRRAGPAAAARPMSLTGLLVTLGLSAFLFSPWPHWWPAGRAQPTASATPAGHAEPPAGELAVTGGAAAAETSLPSAADTAAVLASAVSTGRQAAQRTQAMICLKQIALAMYNFHAARGHFPPAAIYDSARAAPAAQMHNAAVVISADRITVRMGRKTVGQFKHHLDRQKGTIDLMAGSRTAPGIYQLKGDRLTICYSEWSGGGRPTRFVFEPDSDNDLLWVLRRM